MQKGRSMSRMSYPSKRGSQNRCGVNWHPCSCCGRAKDRIGEDVTKILEYVPSGLEVHEHVRPKYACRYCKNGVSSPPPPPRPIARGIADISHLLVGWSFTSSCGFALSCVGVSDRRAQPLALCYRDLVTVRGLGHRRGDRLNTSWEFGAGETNRSRIASCMVAYSWGMRSDSPQHSTDGPS